MSILKSSFVVSFWTLISRILGFLRDVALANKLGASAASDAFFIALTLPNLLRRLLAEGAFNVAFIPLFTEKLNGSAADRQVFLNVVVSWMLVLLVSITLLAEIIMPALVAILAPGFVDDPERFNLTIALARVTFPYLILITMASLVGALCNSIKKFAFFAATPTLLNVGLVGALFGLTPLGISPVWAATFGVPLGGIFQVLLMLYALYAHTPFRPQFTLQNHPDTTLLLKRFWPAALGVGVLQISYMIDMMLASFLYEKAVTYLQFANRFYQMPLSLIGISLSTVLLPHFANAISKGDHHQANFSFQQAMLGGISLAMAATVGIVVLADEMILTLLQHGAFTVDAATATALAMAAYTLGLPGYILTKITSTAFFANGDTRTPVKAALYALALNLVANAVFMQFLGHVGIALATAVSGWGHALLLMFWLKKTGIFLVKWRHIQPIVLKSLPLCLFMAVTLWLYSLYVPFTGGFALEFLWLSGGIGLGVVLFTIGVQWLGIFDLKALARRRTK